jgi:hypothetical protein
MGASNSLNQGFTHSATGTCNGDILHNKAPNEM